VPTLAYNKRANYDYEILEKYEAGLILYGHEVKSVKTGHISLKGAFVTVKQSRARLPQLYLTNSHIPKYKKASTIDSYDPERPRQLLLHKNEIKRLIGKRQVEGLTLVPLRVYTRHSRLKLEFALARGKKKYDKRETIKKREVDRQMRRVVKAS
jgi:SsrA-binding protein